MSHIVAPGAAPALPLALTMGDPAGIGAEIALAAWASGRVARPFFLIDDPARLASLSVLDEIFNCLTAWFAPILCFTAEEAWLARTGDTPGNSVHLRQFPVPPDSWRDDALAAKWAVMRRVRRVVTGALEIERAEKRIGASLEAHPVVYAEAGYRDAVAGLDLAEITIVSGITLRGDSAPAGAFTVDDVPGVAVVPERAQGTKCVRCYRLLPDVDDDEAYPGLCARCVTVVADQAAGAERAGVSDRDECGSAA